MMIVGRKEQGLLGVTAVLVVLALVAVAADELRLAIAALVLLDAVAVAGFLLLRSVGPAGAGQTADRAAVDEQLVAAVEAHGAEMLAIQRSIDHLAEVVLTEVHARGTRTPGS